MLPYGSRKRGAKLHPHNKCGVCAENRPVKARERGQSRLIESARYSDEMADRMIEREKLESGEIEEFDGAKMAQRCREIDPDGRETFKVLKIMEVERAMRDSRLKRKRS